MKKIYRFAVIGFGARGRQHARMMEENARPRAACVAVCDVREPTTAERKRFRDRFYRDYRALLRKEKDLDFVIVSSQEAQHVRHALGVLRKGVPIYLEKAVSNTWGGAVKLYTDVVRESLPLFVGYNLRRFPASLATEKLLRAGRIGRLQSVLAHVNTGNEWSSDVFLRSYYSDAALSGDIVLSKLTHDTEWVQHVLDTRAETCAGITTRNVWTQPPHRSLHKEYVRGADTDRPAPSSHDVCCATGRFENETAFTFLFTTAGPDYERRYVWSGTRGQIETVLHTSRPGAAEASVVLWPCRGRPRQIRVGATEGSHGGADQVVHRDFFRWLATKPSAPNEPESILLGMIIPTAALESARTGRRIDCAQRLRKAMANV